MCTQVWGLCPPTACTTGYLKDSVFLPPVPQDMLRTLPQDLPEVRRRIIPAISEIDRDMLQRVRAGTDYGLDACRDTKGGHTQHLRDTQKKLGRVSLPICRWHVIIFPPFKCADFMKCQRIMNNPVLSRTSQQKAEAPRRQYNTKLRGPRSQETTSTVAAMRTSKHVPLYPLYSQCFRLCSQRQHIVVHDNKRKWRCHGRQHVRCQKLLRTQERTRRRAHTCLCGKEKDSPFSGLGIHYNEDHKNHIVKRLHNTFNSEN
jgi:hypothetical protein